MDKSAYIQFIQPPEGPGEPHACPTSSEHRSLPADGAVGAVRSKQLNPKVRHLVAVTEVELVEVGAARGKPLDPNVRDLVAVNEVELVEVGAARSELLDPKCPSPPRSN